MDTYWKARQSCVWWKNNHNDVIWAEGKDAASYLQSQITQDILKLKVGEGISAALVDRKGHIQSLFSVHRYEEMRYLLVPENNSEQLFAHLEAFHFVEEIHLQKMAMTRIHLEGPQTADILKTITGKVLGELYLESIHSAPVPGGSAILIPQSLLGEDGVTFFLKETPSLFIQLLREQLKLSQLTEKAYHCLRIEAGKPLWGQDLNAETQLPSTGQEMNRVSYDKGCYLGQEVIARIRSYGVPPYKLMGFQFESFGDGALAKLPALGSFEIEGKKRGEWTSICWSPHYKTYLALGYLHKKYRKSGQQHILHQGGESYNAEIKRLPFYTPADKSVQAQALYDQALNAFAEDQETVAIGLLQSAIAKDVQLADAYESLGVILSRQGRHEDAITVMKQLTKIAPEEPMAHTNLSRFYMLLGDKTTAEEHMAEATRLDMLKKMSVQKQEALLAEDHARKIDMIEMFKEVLETEDPEDLVANFGLGKALVDLERYAESEAYLQKAVTIDPFYSAAYLQLGKALSALHKDFEAKQVYTQGIQAASEKGDLMPMKEMEQRLMGLSI